jgi:hypothetical protein
MKRATLLFAGILTIAIVPAARAEINFGESIDWVIADSDRVVVGKLVKVENVAGHEVVTVDVSKTIRGKQEPKATFVLRSYHGAIAKDWLDAGVPMLFFLRSREHAKDADKLPKCYDWQLRDDGNYPSAVILAKQQGDGSRSLNVFTRDFGMLTDSAAILKYVEAYAKTIPADWKKKKMLLDVPGDTKVFEKLWGGSAVFLSVPVDAQLETLARRWCKSKDIDDRVRGAKILGNFKNDENIKLLKSLLQDPEFHTGDGMRRYAVRAAAFESLRGFGVDVPRPVLEQPDNGAK